MHCVCAYVYMHKGIPALYMPIFSADYIGFTELGNEIAE